jgi:hypothetical protein
VVTFNGNGRHTAEERNDLKQQLGANYKTIPGNAPHFPNTDAGGACLNCHMPGRVTVAALNCDLATGFFNAFGARLCRIRPFEKDRDGTFTTRVNDAIKGTILGLESFEPKTTLQPISLEVNESLDDVVLPGSALAFEPGLDLLDGQPAKVIKAYIKEDTARSFFEVSVAADGSAGEIKVINPLSGFAASETMFLTVLPVNDGGPTTPGVATGAPGFYPVAFPAVPIRIDIRRERPIGQDDTAQVSVGQAVDIDVLANDTLGGPTTGIEKLSDPAQGTLTVVGNKFRYVANGGTGTTTFTYRAVRNLASGTQLFSEPLTVTITIFPADVPVAQDDGPVLATIGEVLTIDALANDYTALPPAALPLRFEILTPQPTALGNAGIVGNKIEYTPASAVGRDVIEYRIANAANVGTTARITINITDISGDKVAGLTNNPEFKPVARALGDSCNSILAAGGPADNDLVKICNALIDAGAGTVDGSLDSLRNEEMLATGDAAQQHDRNTPGQYSGASRCCARRRGTRAQLRAVRAPGG